MTTALSLLPRPLRTTGALPWEAGRRSAVSGGSVTATIRPPGHVRSGSARPSNAVPWHRAGAAAARHLWRMLAARPDTGRGGRHAAASPARTSATPPPAATLDELYHSRRLSLVRLAVLMVDDLPTAEDIVQDAFTAMYRRHGSDLRGIADPHAYLTTSVMNAARSALRRRRSARAYVPPRPGISPAAEEHVLLADGDREILAALHSLTARQRQVVVLRYWSDLSESDIAETLRVSRGTVKSTTSRALAVLRRMLAER